MTSSPSPGTTTRCEFEERSTLISWNCKVVPRITLALSILWHSGAGDVIPLGDLKDGFFSLDASQWMDLFPC